MSLGFDAALASVRSALSPDLLRPAFRRRRPDGAARSWGLCYVAAEALYHLLGGSASGLRPTTVRAGDVVHWYLVDARGRVVDPTADQFEQAPAYAQGVGRGFLTREPSRRARELMGRAQTHVAAQATA